MEEEAMDCFEWDDRALLLPSDLEEIDVASIGSRDRRLPSSPMESNDAVIDNCDFSTDGVPFFSCMLFKYIAYSDSHP
jgi:hypothetical protein